MHLDIVLWPDPVLLTPTEPVLEVDDELRLVVAGMRRVMFELRGVGLAAPQVGISKRLMLVCPSGEPGAEEVVLNPEIVEKDTAVHDGEEGCLSFPGIYGLVPRSCRVVVRYRDLDWRARQLELRDFVARVFLHEFDHLEGKVFIDRMLPEYREKAEGLLKELRERYAEPSAG